MDFAVFDDDSERPPVRGGDDGLPVFDGFGEARVLKAGRTSTPPMVAPVLRKLRRLVRYVVVMVGLP